VNDLPFTPPIAVDYTSRDFYALREDLIRRINARIPEWTGEDPTDFGVALVEAFAYSGDVLNYYVDRVANETTLETATQRRSVLALAASYGYVPSGFSAASCVVQLINASDSVINLPAGTQLAGSYDVGERVNNVVFTLTDDVEIPAEGATTASASHGESTDLLYPASGPGDVPGELVGVSNGEPNQQMFLSEVEVVSDSVEVFVQFGDTFGQWQKVDFLPDSGPTDSVYELQLDDQDRLSIVFGDGVSGAIPNAYSAVKVRYIVGGGEVGNIPINSLNQLYRVPGLDIPQVAALQGVLTVSNISPGVGGRNPDSLDLIRAVAPRIARTNNRAVTLADYGALALQASDVAKANPTAAVASSVVLYVAPVRPAGSPDLYPLYDEDNNLLTPEWDALRDEVESVLVDRVPIGTTVTVSPPTYLDVSMEVKFALAPQFLAGGVAGAIQSAILQDFSYQSTNFADVVYPEQVEAVLRQVPGVRNVRVTKLFRTSTSSDAREILVAQPGEIFVFNPTNITVTPVSSEASLTNATFSTGTLSPALNSAFFNYTLTVGGATTSVDIASFVSAGATLLVNGTQESPAIDVPVATPTATTPVTISVVAEDGVTRNDYSIVIVKS
jgi:hypothetical protein